MKRAPNVGGDHLDLESCESSSGPEDDEGVDGELWSQSGVHSHAYRRGWQYGRLNLKGRVRCLLLLRQ